MGTRIVGALTIGALIAASCASSDQADETPAVSEVSTSPATDPPATTTTTSDVEPTTSAAQATTTPPEPVHELYFETRFSDEVAANWDTEIAPRFVDEHPGFSVKASPIQGAGYNSEVRNRLAAGTAGDLIACRAFDQPGELYEEGFLVDLADEEFIARFDDAALEGWRSFDGTAVTCLPVNSVTTGFFYNAEALDELGLEVPTTMDELMTLLVATREDGRYVPIALGTKTRSRALNALFYLIGPTYWDGDAGRAALIAGELRFDDRQFVDLLTAMDELSAYFPEASEFMSNVEARDLFVSGGALLYPGGSWEIASLSTADFEVSVFAPPTLEEGDRCVMLDQHDFGIGINADGDVEGALTFLEWASGPTFAEAHALAFPGRFSLQADAPPSPNPLAAATGSLLAQCDHATRLDSGFLDRSESQDRATTLRDSANAIVQQTSEPFEQAKLLQDDLDSWYVPGES